MTEIAKKPRLTKKQKGFADDYALTGNGSFAAKQNYNVSSDLTARSIASENLTKPHIVEAIEIKQQTLKSALEKQGVTPERIAEKINVLLEATKPVFVKDKETGESECVDEAPDYQAIDKGIAHATKIYGIGDETEKPKSNTTYNFIFSKEVQDEVKEIEAKIKARLINHVPET